MPTEEPALLTVTLRITGPFTWVEANRLADRFLDEWERRVAASPDRGGDYGVHVSVAVVDD
jgi:hypothetical protein